VLFQNMMRIWRRTFQTASLLVLLALVVLGYAVFLPDQRRGLWWAWTCVAVVLTIALIYGLCRWIRTSRPILGTQD
jgi:peptidoglycan/LPS O-acetylase OafA/YrhL